MIFNLAGKVRAMCDTEDGQYVEYRALQAANPAKEPGKLVITVFFGPGKPLAHVELDAVNAAKLSRELPSLVKQIV